MAEAVKELGCMSPNNPNIMYLGAYSVGRDLHSIYVDDMNSRNENGISSKYFVRLFKGKFGKLKLGSTRDPNFPEVRLRNGEAGKCDICLQAAASFRTGTPAERISKKKKFKGTALCVKYIVCNLMPNIWFGFDFGFSCILF